MRQSVFPLLIAQAFWSAAFASCMVPDDQVWTLYRSGTVPGYERVHVASFDAEAGKEYNLENCDTARRLFAQQPGIKVQYWCEQGRFQP